MIKFYKVGGCIRDKLLGIVAKDIDYVVVGATISYMKDLGFTTVGKDFPVFIHPQTGCQYALARTERKNGHGYHGFDFYYSPKVRLEDDLSRRDITINAIAEDEDGKLIDPFHGIDDLNKKIIRHISNAFCEDPLRVLRVARFYALLPGFSIHGDTLQLMQQVANSGELEYIAKERITEELRKAFTSTNPMLFFEVLYKVRALEHILIVVTPLIENRELVHKIEHIFLKQSINFSNEEKFAIIIASTLNMGYKHLASQLSKLCLGQSYQKLAKVIIDIWDKIVKIRLLGEKDIDELICQLDERRQPERLLSIRRVMLTIMPCQHEFEFFNALNKEYKNINYYNLHKSNHNAFIQKLNDIKFLIINRLHKIYYESSIIT